MITLDHFSSVCCCYHLLMQPFKLLFSLVRFSKRHLTVVPILVLLSMYVPFEQGYKSAQPFQRNRIWISDKTPLAAGR